MRSRLRRDIVTKHCAKDTDEESDEDGPFSGKEEHDVHIMSRFMCNKENISPRRTTRSVTRIRSRNYQASTTVSDIDPDDWEVDMGKLKG